MTAVEQALRHARDSRRAELIARFEGRGFRVQIFGPDERRDGRTAVELRRGSEVVIRVSDDAESLLEAMSGAGVR